MIDLQNERLVVLDVETTGPNPGIHDVLSLALVPLDSRIAPLSIYVNPMGPTWTAYARRLFEQYRLDWEASAVRPEEAFERIDHYLVANYGAEPVTPVGHNIGFDLSFLQQLALKVRRPEGFRNLSHRAVDTHTLLYWLFLQGRIPREALSSDGAFRYFNIQVNEGQRHTALGDAEATRQLFMRILEGRALAPYSQVRRAV